MNWKMQFKYSPDEESLPEITIPVFAQVLIEGIERWLGVISEDTTFWDDIPF